MVLFLIHLHLRRWRSFRETSQAPLDRIRTFAVHGSTRPAPPFRPNPTNTETRMP